MFKVMLEHRLIIKTRQAVDTILDTTGDMRRDIRLTADQLDKVGQIDELAFRIRAILAKLSVTEIEKGGKGNDLSIQS